MKNIKHVIINAIVLLFIVISFCNAQAPGKMNYQAVLRDASGSILENSNVNLEINILQGSASGTAVFTETHTTTTNSFGLVNLAIGSNNPAGFSGINWANGSYFIKIKVDNVEMGTSQLLSVPYALYAASGAGEQGPQGIPGLKGDKGDPGDTKWEDASSGIKYNGDAEVDGHVKTESLSVGSGDLKIIGFTELTGTTAADENFVDVVLPSSFNSFNCRLISLEIFYQLFHSQNYYYYTLGYSDGVQTVYAALTKINNGLLFPTYKLHIRYPDNLKGKDFRAVLMKVE